MAHDKLKGVLFGLLSGASFGLIPMFSLTVMNDGMNYDSILFYRFFFAVLTVAVMMLRRKESFKIAYSKLPVFLILGVFYAISSLFLIWSYLYLPSGVATVLHFTFPIFVTALMFFIYREKVSIIKLIAILVAIAGVYFLSMTENGKEVEWLGLIIVIISAIGYALYIVGVNKVKLTEISSTKMTLYILGICCIIFFTKANIEGKFQMIPDFKSLVNLVALAIVPTVISNISLVRAIKYIGSTSTSVLGAMEPMTAVFTGVLIFGEPFTVNIVVGIILTIIAVTTIVSVKETKTRNSRQPLPKQ